MCKFCDLLYSAKQADDSELNIQVDTGDPYQSGILSNITFCPYCGRNLKELYGPFVKGVLKGGEE